MAKVSITEAARLAGISRYQLYRGYINKGVLTVDKDTQGRPLIDTSELLRVFGELTMAGRDAHTVDSNVAHQVTRENGQEHTESCRELLDSCRLELSRALEREREAIAREKWLREKLDAMEQKLLTGPETKRRWWWPW